MCSETCPALASSFLDLPQRDKEAVGMLNAESGSSLHSSSDCEFEFGISTGGLEHMSSAADELFANGVILPFQIQPESLAAKGASKSEAGAAVHLPFLISIPRPPTWDDDDGKKTEEIALIRSGSGSGSDREKVQSWSFWGIRRSTSLNSDKGCTRKSSSFPSQLLSRSKSTSSVLGLRRSSSHRRQASSIPKPLNSSSASSVTAKRASEAAAPLPFLTPLPSPTTCCDDDKKIERTEENAFAPSRSGSDQEKLQSWSFWGFRRSTSLNSGDLCTSKSSVIQSQLLSKSKSTGSVPAPRRSSSLGRKASHIPKPSYSSSTSHSYPWLQKAPSKKNHGLGASHGSTVRVSPVLNLPTLCISKGAANVFSLGCFAVKEQKNKA
ncbi:uncharacterized protein LOC115744205 isoform X1 [Rhodamnia argentea]|uniref:Uncharacterized protein LOC115744205 isoform X1 n=1 Tax=Rhodamnia argentea TaxID=178133 RepID=A0A8B8PKC5_9MYRT|nr:uncharacterized protein LOC115744205 isoform X1 [Rhodamnia argentea]